MSRIKTHVRKGDLVDRTEGPAQIDAAMHARFAREGEGGSSHAHVFQRIAP